MGAMQNLRVQFGIISFDVAMQKATNERNAIAFNRLHKHKDSGKKDKDGNPIYEPCLGPTGQKIYCKACNAQDLASDAMTKGYEFRKGEFIEVTEQELDSLKVDTNGAIAVKEIVPTSELTKRMAIMTGNVYYLTPPAKAKFLDPTYGLMFTALQGDRVAIGHTAMYGRTQACAIVAGPNCFLMYTLRYPEEIRPAPNVQLPAVDQNQLKMAKQILDLLGQTDIDFTYHDDYEAAKKNLIDMKMAGMPIQQPVAQQPVVVNNSVEDMLKKTLEALQANPPKQPKATAPPKEEQPVVVAKKGGRKKTA